MLRSVVRRMQRLREVTDFFSRLKEETGKIKKREMIEEFVISHNNDKQLVFDVFEIGTMRYKPSSLSKMFFLTQEKVIKSCALLADPETENEELTWAEFMRTIEELKTMSGTNLFERQRILFNSIFSKKARKVDFEFVQKVLLNSLSLGASLATFKQAVRNCIGKEGWGPSEKQSFESLINQSLEEDDFNFFVPIESQLAKSTVSAEDLQKDLRKHHGEVLHIEPKLDGERLQIHVDLKTQKILMFTRKLANVTKRYLFAIPTILAECEKMGLHKAIFDGEIIAWNLDFNGFCSFQDLK